MFQINIKTNLTHDFFFYFYFIYLFCITAELICKHQSLKKTTAEKQTLASLIVVGYVTLHYLLLVTAYFLCASNKGEIVNTA